MEQIIRETKLSYNDYLARLPLGCQDIADDIRKDNLKKALNSILQFSEGVSWLIEANSLLEKNLIINSIDAVKINEFLTEVNAGLEMQDFVLVADMFEYEIKPFFEACSFYELSEEQ